MFSDLIGETIILVEEFPEEIIFTVLGGAKYKMYHEQDCCEEVNLESVDQPWEVIYGSPVLAAEERSNQKENEDGRTTWTFYKIATVRGTVNIRWVGSSNGYYSEDVSFEKIANGGNFLTA